MRDSVVPVCARWLRFDSLLFSHPCLTDVLRMLVLESLREPEGKNERFERVLRVMCTSEYKSSDYARAPQTGIVIPNFSAVEIMRTNEYKSSDYVRAAQTKVVMPSFSAVEIMSTNVFKSSDYVRVAQTKAVMSSFSAVDVMCTSEYKSSDYARVWKCGKTTILVKNASHSRSKQLFQNPRCPGSLRREFFVG